MRSRGKSKTWTQSTRSLFWTSKTWWPPIPPVGLVHWHINRQSRRCRCSIILLQCKAQLSALYVCVCDEHLLQGNEGSTGQAVCAMYSARCSGEQFAESSQDRFWFAIASCQLVCIPRSKWVYNTSTPLICHMVCLYNICVILDDGWKHRVGSLSQSCPNSPISQLIGSFLQDCEATKSESQSKSVNQSAFE